MSQSSKPITPAAGGGASGGGNTGLYIGIGVVLFLAIGGGLYFYSSSKKKSSKSPDAGTSGGGSAMGGVGVGTGTGITGQVAGVTSGSTTGGGTGTGATSSGTTTPSTTGTTTPATTGGAASNDYVAGSTIDQRNAEQNMLPYSPTVADPAGFSASINSLLNLSPDFKTKLETKEHKKKAAAAAAALANATPYVKGFLKGVNSALRADYVQIFGQPITDYMNNPAKINEATATVGQFLLPS